MSSSREVAKQAFDLLQNALEESEARIAELSKELRHKRPTKNGLEKRLDVFKQRLQNSAQDRDRWKTEAGHLEELVENTKAKADQLRAKLAIAESGSDKLTKQEINFWRAKVESFDTQATEYKARIQALQQECEALHAENARLQEEFGKEKEHAENLSETAANTVSVQDAREADTLTERLKERDSKLTQLAAQGASLEAENARLQEELGEEEERAENLSEVANERLDQVNKFREQREEAEERLEEAEWRLDKSKHFEGLVQRRKGVISSLIAATRTKAKANIALKAGLDSLRRHKATAQATQQKLLAQIDRLTSDLGAAKEAASAAKELDRRSQDPTPEQKEEATGRLRVSELEERVNTQAELIESLEDDLQLAKIVQLDLSNKTTEAQKQLDEQQSAGEALSVAAAADRDNDRSMITALELEVTELRDQLEAQTNSAKKSADTNKEDLGELSEKLEQSQAEIQKLTKDKDDLSGLSEKLEQSQAEIQKLTKDNDDLSELSEKLKQSQAKIQKLTEVANTWKRKYKFLSTDAPEAYQTQAAAEK